MSRLRFGLAVLALGGALAVDAFSSGAMATIVNPWPESNYNGSIGINGTAFFAAYGLSTASNDVTGIVNGHTFRAVTAASSFLADFNSNTAYAFQIYVDGQLIISDSGNNWTNADTEKFLQAIFGNVTVAAKAVQSDTLRSQTQQVTGLIARRVSQVLVPRPASFHKKDMKKADAGGLTATYADGITGLSSGDELGQLALWATGSYSWLGNSFADTRYKGKMAAGILGADYRAGPLVIGLAVSFENADIDTFFNNGDTKKTGVGATPYIAYSLFDDRLVLDVMGGYASANTEATKIFIGRYITGEYNSTRMMAGTHATWTQPIDNWSLGGKVGFVYARERSEAYRDSSSAQEDPNITRLGEISIGPRVGYTLDAFEPYISASYINDIIMTTATPTSTLVASPPNDRDEVEGVIGLNWFPSDTMTASLEASRSFFREKISSTSVSLNLRKEF